jgi:hypothetical protein
MAFFDEPKDTKDTAQVLTDTSATEVGQNQGQVWLRTKDSSSVRQLSPWSIVGDAVVWIAGAGLVGKLFVAVQKLIDIGVIAQNPALFFTIVLLVFCGFYAYSLLIQKPGTLLYRITLFIVCLLLTIV